VVKDVARKEDDISRQSPRDCEHVLESPEIVVAVSRAEMEIGAVNHDDVW